MGTGKEREEVTETTSESSILFTRTAGFETLVRGSIQRQFTRPWSVEEHQAFGWSDRIDIGRCESSVRLQKPGTCIQLVQVEPSNFRE